MGEQLVPTRATPCSPQDMYKAMLAEWRELYPDELPSRASLCLLVAHWAFETGWGHACFNGNVGNRRHAHGASETYMLIPCSEIVNGVEVFYRPETQPERCQFVAYPSILDGVRAYLVHLRAEFRAAWPFVLAGDVPGFCHALKLAGYYTADEAVYTHGTVACAAMALRLIPPEDAAAYASASVQQAALDIHIDDPDEPPPTA